MPVDARRVHDYLPDSRSTDGDIPWPDVHVGFQPTPGNTQSVQGIAFDFRQTFSDMDLDSRDSILGFLKTLVRDIRPEILLMFPTTKSAASLLEEVSVLNIPALIVSGRVSCVLQFEEQQT